MVPNPKASKWHSMWLLTLTTNTSLSLEWLSNVRSLFKKREHVEIVPLDELLMDTSLAHGMIYQATALVNRNMNPSTTVYLFLHIENSLN